MSGLEKQRGNIKSAFEVWDLFPFSIFFSSFLLSLFCCQATTKRLDQELQIVSGRHLKEGGLGWPLSLYRREVDWSAGAAETRCASVFFSSKFVLCLTISFVIGVNTCSVSKNIPSSKRHSLPLVPQSRHPR